MKQTTKNIDELHNWEKNPRSISEKGFERLKKQIQTLGMYKPLLVTEDGTVLGGNMRLRAYRELGIKDVWVSVVDAPTEEKKLEYALSDNDRAGFYDDDLLANLTGELPDFNWGDYSVDLKEPTNLADLLDQFKEVVEDEVPEVSDDPPVSKLGDIYQLGRHKIMCGDSTKIEDVEKLMDGKKADMVFTDPPYGIDWDADEMGLKGNHGFGKLKNDDIELDLSLLLNMDCLMVIWGAQNFIKQLPHSGRWICWDKRTNEKADHTIGSDFELAWTNKTSGYSKMYRIQHGGYINADGHGEKRVHPTQKPIRLFSEILDDQKAGNLVLDLFLGSGSTLIACEQTNRTCYGMELDPKYCDVIRKRYAKFIGKEDEWQTITPAI